LFPNLWLPFGFWTFIHVELVSYEIVPEATASV
jgi:hypothetical protein